MTVIINITKREKILINPDTGQKIDRLPTPGQPMQDNSIDLKAQDDKLNNKQ